MTNYNKKKSQKGQKQLNLKQKCNVYSYKQFSDVFFKAFQIIS